MRRFVVIVIKILNLNSHTRLVEVLFILDHVIRLASACIVPPVLVSEVAFRTVASPVVVSRVCLNFLTLDDEGRFGQGCCRRWFRSNALKLVNCLSHGSEILFLLSESGFGG